MFRRLFTTVAVVAVVVAIFFADLKLRVLSNNLPELSSRTTGFNNTVLFLTNCQSGLSNVHLATAQSLIERHPSVRVHYASFPEMAAKVARVSSLAKLQDASAPRITFHEITGQSYIEANTRKIGLQNLFTDWAEHRPGFKGRTRRDDILRTAISPWEGESFRSLYEEIKMIINAVRPGVVVLDTIFSPAIEATRDLNRRHVFIAPGSLSDDLAFEQPYAQGFWKYPGIGSDAPFPVPWYRIPENIYLGLRHTYVVGILPQWWKRAASLLPKPGVYTSKAFLDGRDLWIAPHIPGATLPLDVIPEGFVGTNSIVLRSATAAQQDPELAEWLHRAPTLLVNMGSMYTYTQDRASVMAQAIQVVLAQTKVQVLWKLSPISPLDDDFRAPLEEYVREGRIRISPWLTIDATAMFETGQIIASVHHGGANSYHEALAGGVPHVIAPMWVDLYNYAMLAELTGVGIYATRGTAPDWSVQGLSNAFLEVVNGPHSAEMREKARGIGRLIRKEPGSHQAAKVIAGLAALKSPWPERFRRIEQE